MLTGGGDSCADIETLGSQVRLFGSVCSDSTLYRTFTDTMDDEALIRARGAMSGVRADVWRWLPQLTDDGPVVLDVDAPLVEIHSENKGDRVSPWRTLASAFAGDDRHPPATHVVYTATYSPKPSVDTLVPVW